MENLQKQLNELENRRSELFRLKEPIDAELCSNYDKIEKLKNQLATQKIKTGNVSWNYLLTPDAGKEVYKEANNRLAKFDLSMFCYFPETNQMCVRIGLIKNSQESYSKVIAGLKEVLPFILPLKDGYKHIGVFESTLGEHGVYNCLINEQNNDYKLIFCYYSRKIEKDKFTSLEELISYVQKNHYYE